MQALNRAIEDAAVTRAFFDALTKPLSNQALRQKADPKTLPPKRQGENRRDYRARVLGAQRVGDNGRAQPVWDERQEYRQRAAVPTIPVEEAPGVVFVFHPEDPALQHLPDGTHVILQRKLPSNGGKPHG